MGATTQRFVHLRISALCDIVLVCGLASANYHHVPCVSLGVFLLFSTQVFVIMKII